MIKGILEKFIIANSQERGKSFFNIFLFNPPFTNYREI